MRDQPGRRRRTQRKWWHAASQFLLGGPAVALLLAVGTVSPPAGAATAPAALTRWFHHETSGLNRVLDEYATIISKASNEATSTLHAQCKAMATTAHSLLHAPAVPNKTIEKQWKVGLTQLAGAGTKCQTARTYAAGEAIGKQLDKGIEGILNAVHGLDQAGIGLQPITPALDQISSDVSALADGTTTQP